MRAAIIAWDEEKGIVVLSAGPNTFTLDPSLGDMQKDAEQFVRLEKYLRALAPQLPPSNLDGLNDGPLPEITEEQLANAQRFAIPRAAKGVKAKPSKITQEELDKLLEDL